MKHPPDTDHETDDDIAGVIDETIDTLVLLRARHHDTNAGVKLDALSALIAQARSRLAEFVADARDQANTWAEIADALSIGRPRAIARYWLHTHKRRPPLELD